MPIAVFSDVHANLEALDAALEAAAGLNATATYVTGDIVGYGADPEAVIERLETLDDTRVIAGNHDLAATGRFDLGWFNEAAAAAIRWTEGQLGRAGRAALDRLEPKQDGPPLLVHGSVVAPAEEYVMPEDRGRARASFEVERFDVCFFGHTHVPTAFATPDGDVEGRYAEPGTTLRLEPGTRYMLNPGSVGQPRDGNPEAAFAIYDPEDGTVTWHRVAYDIDAAQRKIRAARLPEILAARLEVGM